MLWKFVSCDQVPLSASFWNYRHGIHAAWFYFETEHHLLQTLIRFVPAGVSSCIPFASEFRCILFCIHWIFFLLELSGCVSMDILPATACELACKIFPLPFAETDCWIFFINVPRPFQTFLNCLLLPIWLLLMKRWIEIDVWVFSVGLVARVHLLVVNDRIKIESWLFLVVNISFFIPDYSQFPWNNHPTDIGHVWTESRYEQTAIKKYPRYETLRPFPWF